MVVARRSRKKVTFRRRSRKGTPSTSVKKKLGTIQRSLRSAVSKDNYYFQGTNNLPQLTGVYPTWESLISPLAWTRMYGLFGTTPLEQKDQVYLKNIRLTMRYSLEGASAGIPFQVHSYIVSLKREGKSIFPTGMTNTGFTNFQTHLENGGLNQLNLNPHVFKIHKRYEFVLSPVLDGALGGIPTSNLHDSSRKFAWAKRMNMRLGDNLDSWKALNTSSIPATQQLYLMVWCAPSVPTGGTIVNPQLNFQVTYDLESGN